MSKAIPKSSKNCLPASVHPKHKRKGRQKGKASPSHIIDETSLEGNASSPNENCMEPDRRTGRRVFWCCKGAFSGLRDIDSIHYSTLQIQRIQGDPEETVYLTDSDEEIDETTDIEEGGFEGAELRKKNQYSEETSQGNEVYEPYGNPLQRRSYQFQHPPDVEKSVPGQVNTQAGLKSQMDIAVWIPY